MKKRNGFFLIEIIISVMLMMSILIFILPLWGNMTKAINDISLKLKKEETRTMSQSFMEEHIKNNKERTKKSFNGQEKSITYHEINEYGNIAPYKIKIRSNKWYIKLYNDRIQPITSGEIEVHAENEKPFYIYKNGLIKIKYKYKAKNGKEMEVQTAILSLADYYKKGEKYE